MNPSLLKLTVLLFVLPLSGCFTGMAHFMDNHPSTGGKIVAGTLDVVTFPVQAVVFGPMIVSDIIDSNTGERGRQKRIANERSALRRKLEENFDLIYSNPDYLSPTNTLAREAVREYFRYKGYNSLDPGDARKLSGIASSRHELAETLEPIWYRCDIPACDRIKAVEEIDAHKEAHETPRTLMKGILNHSDVSDVELERLVARKEQHHMLAGVAEEIVEIRMRERERTARIEAERKAREERLRIEAEEARRRRTEEARRKSEIRTAEMLKHNERMRRIASNIWSEDGSFAEVLENIDDPIVGMAVSTALRDKSKPIPAENVEAIVNSGLNSTLKTMSVLRLALKRPELSAETLRGDYEALVKLQRGDELYEFMTGYLSNPNLPDDVSRRAWREPLLAECRKVFFYHSDMPGMNDARRERVMVEMNEFAKEMHAKHFTRDERNKRLDSILKKYLPKEAPNGWVKKMP